MLACLPLWHSGDIRAVSLYAVCEFESASERHGLLAELVGVVTWYGWSRFVGAMQGSIWYRTLGMVSGSSSSGMGSRQTPKPLDPGPESQVAETTAATNAVQVILLRRKHSLQSHSEAFSTALHAAQARSMLDGRS